MEKENAFMESKIVQLFQAYADAGKQPTVCEWKDLQNLVETNLPAFWKKCLCLRICWMKS